MKNIILGKNIILISWIYYIIYNSYFGWNWDSQSDAESNCDTIFKIIVYVGITIYLIPLFKLYEKLVKEHLN